MERRIFLSCASIRSRAVTRGSTQRRAFFDSRSEEHTSELQSQSNLVCRLLLEKKKKIINQHLHVQHHQHLEDNLLKNAYTSKSHYPNQIYARRTQQMGRT